MSDNTYQAVLKELVDWLASMERLAHDVYKVTAEALSADASVSGFIASLAENEAQHAELISEIKDILAKPADVPPPAIRLDATLREIIETPLRKLQAEVRAGTITRKRAIALIAEVEFTEWNEIFLYVLGTFGKQDRDMEKLTALIQEHERRIEAFIAGLPLSVRPEQNISKLAKIWNVRLLIVDDSRYMRDLLSGLLSSIGQVTVTENGEEALDETRRHFFDAIVSDLRMPGMNGIEFHRRAVAEHPDLQKRFVFISFDPGRKDEAYLWEQGLPLILKPFAPEELIESVYSITASAPEASRPDQGPA